MWLGLSIIITYLVLYFLLIGILNYKEKEMSKNFQKDDVIVKLPKIVMIIMLVCTIFFGSIAYLFIRYPNGTDVHIMPKGIGYVLSLIMWLSATVGSFVMALGVLLWKIEVFAKEDYFIYHTWFGRTYTIKYSECLEYIEKKAYEGMIVRTQKKRFYIHVDAANSGRFMHRIRCSKAKKVKKFIK